MHDFTSKVEASKFLQTKEEEENEKLHQAHKTLSKIVKSQKHKRDVMEQRLYELREKNLRRL